MLIFWESQLTHARAQASLEKARDRVSGFIRMTIQAGLLTSGLALLAIVLHSRAPNGTWFFP
jgi:hypothetical protein